MKFIILIIVSLFFTGLILGGGFDLVLYKVDFWLLVSVPLVLIWIGWKLFLADDKILKGTGIFMMAFFTLCWIGIFFSQRIRTSVCSILKIKDYLSVLYENEINWSFWKILLLWVLDWILCFALGIFNTKETDPPQETTDTPSAPNDDDNKLSD